jgi:anti-sigma factor RsiW
MTHPTNDELLDLVYDELDPARAQAVNAHVRTCGDCRAQLATWRGVRSELGRWELPEPRRRVVVSTTAASRTSWLRRTVRSAAAAVLLLAAGYGLARFNAPKPAAPVAAIDTTALRAQLSRDVRNELARELRTQQLQFAADVITRQQDFQQAVATALTELETRQFVAHAALRKDVETVALHAQQEFDQLAVANQADALHDGTRDR